MVSERLPSHGASAGPGPAVRCIGRPRVPGTADVAGDAFAERAGGGPRAPPELLPRLNYLNPDYTVSRYPDAANGVPYELYAEPIARAKVEAAEEVRGLGRETAGPMTDDPRIRRFVADHLPRPKQLYEPELVLAFGSRARGDALEESDLDLIVVSARFRDTPFLGARDAGPERSGRALRRRPFSATRRRSWRSSAMRSAP
jgi:hypothetical protein